MARKAKVKFDARAFLARADGGVTVANYRKGQVVFTQGDPADSIFFIQEGKVKVAVVSQQGKEAVIAFLEAGDFIGEGFCDDVIDFINIGGVGSVHQIVVTGDDFIN